MKYKEVIIRFQKYKKGGLISKFKDGGLYTVAAGNTGMGIANKLGISFSDLKKWNPEVDMEKIKVGQKLYYRDTSKKTQAVPKTTSTQKVTPKQTTDRYYTIKSGDSLGKISQQTGVPLKDLMRLNNIKNAGSIRSGQKLRLRNKQYLPKQTFNSTYPSSYDKLTQEQKNTYAILDEDHKELADQIYAGARKRGLSHLQASALLGSALQESSLKLDAIQSGQGARGLWQYDVETKKAYQAKYGTNYSLDNQLDFLVSKLKNPNPSSFDEIYRYSTNAWKNPKQSTKWYSEIERVGGEKLKDNIKQSYSSDTTGLHNYMKGVKFDGRSANNHQVFRDKNPGLVMNWGATRNNFMDVWNNPKSSLYDLTDVFTKVIEVAGKPEMDMRKHGAAYFGSMYDSQKDQKY